MATSTRVAAAYRSRLFRSPSSTSASSCGSPNVPTHSVTIAPAAPAVDFQSGGTVVVAGRMLGSRSAGFGGCLTAQPTATASTVAAENVVTRVRRVTMASVQADEVLDDDPVEIRVHPE